MIRYIEKAEKMTLYVVPLKGLVVFPTIPQSLELKDKTAKKICISAKENDEPVLLLPLNSELFAQHLFFFVHRICRMHL